MGVHPPYATWGATVQEIKFLFEFTPVGVAYTLLRFLSCSGGLDFQACLAILRISSCADPSKGASAGLAVCAIWLEPE